MSAHRIQRIAVCGWLIALLAGCGGGESGAGTSAAEELARFCETKPFTPPAQSPYRLPYAVGSTFTMFQGNCPPNPAWGHHGKFAYDFDLPLSTPVYAMRAGTVVFVANGYSNDDHIAGHENGVWMMHADGTISNYLHLSPNSVTVLLNASVQPGDYIGLSGNSGASSGPHLHVEAYANGLNFNKSNTVPITFSNAGGATEPSGGLIQGNAYTALP